MDRPIDPAADAQCTALATRLAARAAQVLQDLPRHVHPAWADTIGIAPAQLSAGGPGLLNTVLQARFDLCWPDLSAAHQALELAWLLPPQQLRRVCAARALYAVRGTLARSVNAALRRHARLLIGSESFETLVSLPERRRADTPQLSLQADRVVLDGWALLERGLVWGDERTRRLTALALPPPATPATPATWAAWQDSAASTNHAEFEVAVNQLFPEHQWLFGSRLASLRSV
jgi:hypothetical protein